MQLGSQGSWSGTCVVDITEVLLGEPVVDWTWFDRAASLDEGLARDDMEYRQVSTQKIKPMEACIQTPLGRHPLLFIVNRRLGRGESAKSAEDIGWSVIERIPRLDIAGSLVSWYQGVFRINYTKR